MEHSHHTHATTSSCCHHDHDHAVKKRPDYLLWGGAAITVLAFAAHFLLAGALAEVPLLMTFTHSVYEMVGKMWWGVVFGIAFVGVLSRIPREFIMSILGKGGTLQGILRATFAGVLLDLCSHGILLIGMKLYERGASIGQVMAFLIASPWNSFSLTLILWALVGFKWMIIFLLLSFVIAVISGLVFEQLVKKGTLPANPHVSDLPDGFAFWPELKKYLLGIRFSPASLTHMLWDGLKDSRMVLRWLFFGVVLAALIRTFIDADQFQHYFGASFAGLGLTLLFATVIEVCSEGATPIAADLLTRAAAPGNSFVFLMAGVSTDYTEIMSLKETTRSWKIALFLPLVTLPQVVALGVILNMVGG